jgi:hypothetical protein
MVAEEGFVPPIHGLKSNGKTILSNVPYLSPASGARSLASDRCGIRLLSVAA